MPRYRFVPPRPDYPAASVAHFASAAFTGERRLETLTAIDDHQLRLGHAAGCKVVEHLPPSGLTLAAHILDGEHHLLAVAADAKCDQERDRRSLLVEADFDHRPIQDQPDDVFAGKITLQGLGQP